VSQSQKFFPQRSPAGLRCRLVAKANKSRACLVTPKQSHHRLRVDRRVGGGIPYDLKRQLGRTADGLKAPPLRDDVDDALEMALANECRALVEDASICGDLSGQAFQVVPTSLDLERCHTTTNHSDVSPLM
jgi:hypothetical protein